MIVREFMTPEVFTVTPSDNIADTIALMSNKKIYSLPVIENGQIVGIVTDRDLREISPSPATTLSIFEINYLIDKTTIREIAIKTVTTCRTDSKIEDAALLMREHRIGALPVVDDGKLMGIITETDIMDAFLKIMGFLIPGQRIVIETKDKVGLIYDLVSTIKDNNVNIASLAVNHLDEQLVKILIRLNGDRVEEAIELLDKKGYEIRK